MSAAEVLAANATGDGGRFRTFQANLGQILRQKFAATPAP